MPPSLYFLYFCRFCHLLIHFFALLFFRASRFFCVSVVAGFLSDVSLATTEALSCFEALNLFTSIDDFTTHSIKTICALSENLLPILIVLVYPPCLPLNLGAISRISFSTSFFAS